MYLITVIAIGVTITQCSVLTFAPRTEFVNHLDKPQGRIVGGHAAIPNSHPYMVSLQLRFLWVRFHLCGGALLNERWVLTAGHCVSDSFLVRLLNMDAVVGAHDVDNFGPGVQISTVALRIPHPDYMRAVAGNDIAMLKTITPFTFTSKVQPIRLPSDIHLSNASIILPGWGVLKSTFFIPILPSQLQELSVTYIPFEKCYTQVIDFLEPDEMNPLNEDMHICTGPLGGGKAACSGDSGGPLVLYQTNTTTEVDDSGDENNETGNMNDEGKKATAGSKVEEVIRNRRNGIPILVGVVSWGVYPCGEKGAPTVYTNVSKFMEFINSYLHT